MTALSIVQDAAGRIGLPAPIGLFSSQDQDTIQYRAILNESGKKLVRAHDWQSLTKEHSFTTVATSAQTSSIPTDFDHIINNTMFNRTRSLKVYGPLTPEEWQIVKSGFNTFIVDTAFRIRGGSILMTPDPTAGDSVYYEYVSKNFALSNASTEKAAFSADTDTTVLDEELITKDVTWRFLKAKGLDYAEAFMDFQVELANAKGRDGGARRLSMAHEFKTDVSVNIPEGNWGV